MKEKPPTRAEAIKLMAREPNLIRRPIFRRGDKWVFGFDFDQVAYKVIL
jgi:arsenate reductase-like glutaredoxin family protein